MEELRKKMEERVHFIRRQMEEAAGQAGRAPEEITLLAASKTQSPETVALSAALPIDLFGENRVQELASKFDAGAYGGKQVDMIGHLQKNKVKYTVGRARLIHSVDSLELGQVISKEAGKKGLCQDILLEVNIGREESKRGVFPEELPRLLEEICQLPHIRVRGLMAIPPISAKEGQNRPYFSALRQLFVDIKSKRYDNVHMDCLSMGMTHDYVDAILEGATLVRIGTGIYGPRIYKEETP